EAVERRTEVDELSAVAVDTVACAVGGSVAGNPRVGEVETGDGRAVGAEDPRRARHRVAQGREGSVLVPELHRAEAAAEIGIDFLDLVVGIGLAAQPDGGPDGEAVVEGCLAVDVQVDLLLEDVVPEVPVADAGGAAEVLADDRAGSRVIVA